jgi:hypothetical protein
MVGAAEELKVVKFRSAEVCPVDDVMCVAPRSWCVASVVDTSLVSVVQCPSNGTRDCPCLSSDAERLIVWIDDDADDSCVTRDAPQVRWINHQVVNPWNAFLEPQ